MKYGEHNEPIPETLEEYEELHGKFEYEDDSNHDDFLRLTDTPLNILTTEKREEPAEINSTGVFEVDDKGRMIVNYGKFTEVFRDLNNLVCCNYQFFTPNGRVSKAWLESEIIKTFYESGWKGKIDAPTLSILKTLAGIAYVESLPVNENTIPFENGDLHLNHGQWEFKLNEKRQSAYRLSADYTPRDKPSPLFDKWLNDLFYEDDIPVIQELLGYCLVPTTAVQEAFFLIGPGEEGKSIIGHILKAIMGNAIVEVDTKSLLTKSFQLSQLENKLVVYDDDLKSQALDETGLMKKLISADSALPGEYKFGDPYTFQPYAKVVCCTNVMISALYDTSHGFFRRLHPILVKPKGNRKVIHKFHEHIISNEKEQIVRWALQGLRRLIENDWNITWSKRSREYMGGIQSNRVHFPDFIEEVFDKDLDGSVSSANIVRVYERWCKFNAIIPCKDQTMLKWLNDNAATLQIKKSENLLIGDKRCRGFQGITLKKEWQNSVVF